MSQFMNENFFLLFPYANNTFQCYLSKFYQDVLFEIPNAFVYNFCIAVIILGVFIGIFLIVHGASCHKLIYEKFNEAKSASKIKNILFLSILYINFHYFKIKLPKKMKQKKQK
jgi:hypothetical protein